MSESVTVSEPVAVTEPMATPTKKPRKKNTSELEKLGSTAAAVSWGRDESVFCCCFVLFLFRFCYKKIYDYIL